MTFGIIRAMQKVKIQSKVCNLSKFGEKEEDYVDFFWPNRDSGKRYN